jgi:MFS family permease
MSILHEDKRPSRLVNASPVYYGWVILAVGTFGGIMTSPGQTYVFSAFLNHFIADLELSRSLVSTLYTIGTLTASFLLPYVGRQFDQRGARIMVALISLLLGMACVYMSFVRNATMLCIGFFLLRQLGQGSLSLASKSVINLWWVRRRGLVMGIGGVVGALLSGLFPYVINTLIPLYGWRFTYVILGAILILVMVPIGWVFVRDRPENYGLHPDGLAADGEADKESSAPVEHNWTRTQALRTSSFWLVVAGLASMSMLNTGLTFHLFSVFEDSGLSSAVAASVFVPIAATGAVVQLVGGLLIGRVPIRVMLAVSLSMMGLLLVLAPSLNSLAMAYFFGICMGVQGGLEMIVSSVVFANFFGRRHLGSIVGLASTILVGASALGPMPIGVARDLLGGYAVVFGVFAILPFALAVACLLFCKVPGAPPEE